MRRRVRRSRRAARPSSANGGSSTAPSPTAWRKPATGFTFTRLPPSQWRSARTTNAIERLQEEFKRRIKTHTVLPSADTAAMLFWALLASGQINMRKVDGWRAAKGIATRSPPPNALRPSPRGHRAHQ
jgi:hypothetical protein